MSSELKLDASSQILKSENKDLIFRINKNKSNSQKLDLKSECHIKIENISSNYVALRVRTTKKYSYAVYPIYAIIKPNSFINIKIVYHSNPNEVITSVGHKFRFEGFIIDEKEKNCKDILGLFQQYIKGKKVVKGNIIKKNVIFSFDENNQKNLKENKFNLNNQKNSNINLNNQNIHNINLPSKGNINNNMSDSKKIEKEIEECNELRNIHANLIKKLDDINLYDKKNNLNNGNNANSFIEKIKIGKEIIIKIRNNKYLRIGIAILFLSSIFSGFYFTK